MSKILLEKIGSLTLYKGELTKARRLPPIQQLKCVGKACKLYQPDVVRCYNTGGSGTDIDWTCEADLPEKLRFGRVDVSCEGFSYPGDPYVLKGSCGLEYRLVNISEGKSSSGWFSNISWNEWFERAFLWSLILLTIYYFFGSYIWRFLGWLKRNIRFGPSNPRPFRPSSPRPGGGGGGGGGGGWFPPGGHGGGYDRRPPPDYPPPPPPYSERPKSRPTSDSSSSSSGPGFWSGFGLGNLTGYGLGHLFGRNNTQQPSSTHATTQEYDWERERRGRWGSGGGLFGSSSSWSFPRPSPPINLSFSRPTAGPERRPSARSTASASNSNNDRGEGPSNLGRVRKSTGYGVTNVR